jgi:hypothetical protein
MSPENKKIFFGSCKALQRLATPLHLKTHNKPFVLSSALKDKQYACYTEKTKLRQNRQQENLGRHRTVPDPAVAGKFSGHGYLAAQLVAWPSTIVELTTCFWPLSAPMHVWSGNSGRKQLSAGGSS